MKSLILSAVLSVSLLSSQAQAATRLKLSKSGHPTTLNKRHLLPRQNTIVQLLNNITGGSYAAQIAIGTPPQEQSLAIDTGSSDLWFMDSNAARCSEDALVDFYRGGCASTFDTSLSSSARMAQEGGFNISYLDGSGAVGDYILDDVHLGNDTVKLQQVGLAHIVSLATGIMGIGFTQNVASNTPLNPNPSTYPTIVDQLFDQGIINLKAYSLFLDSKDAETGSVIFGGLDSDKYVGNLIQLPIVPSRLANGSTIYDHFTVVMTGLSMRQGTTTTNFTSSRYRVPVILDSGTTLTYLPDTTVRQLYNEVGAIDDSEYGGLVYVDCDIGKDTSTVFTYSFGDSQRTVQVQVPISELLYSLNDIFGGEDVSALLPDLPFRDTCVFGILPAIEGISLLGDTFLRSAYVVYDLSNNVIAMAQANLNSQQENIVDFEANATSIPRVSGAASVVEATQTATFAGGAPGVPTRRPTGSATSSAGGVSETVTGSSTPSPSTTPTGNTNIGVRSSFDSGAFVVLGVSIIFSLFGGGWSLA